MGMASGDWQVQLQDLVVHGFFDAPTMKKFMVALKWALQRTWQSTMHC